MKTKVNIKAILYSQNYTLLNKYEGNCQNAGGYTFYIYHSPKTND